MLWFILRLSASLCISCDLNTSYVMVHHCIYIITAEIMSFKYILCYGSSEYRVEAELNYCDLNTSYVMVHLIIEDTCQQAGKQFKYILCYGSSFNSIHADIRIIFKYILCYGSSS